MEEQRNDPVNEGAVLYVLMICLAPCVAFVEWLRVWLDLKPPIRPFVVFPGRYVEGSSSGRHVWVLNEKRLLSFVRNEAPCLKPDEIARVAGMLSGRNRQHTSDAG